jgi:hypothetical protein
MLWWCNWENDDNLLLLNQYFLPQLCVKFSSVLYFGEGYFDKLLLLLFFNSLKKFIKKAQRRNPSTQEVYKREA